MSRVTKWKLEKTKVKVVFRLQFHATHIPQSGWDKLFISFVPSDSVKATAKTTKANVRNGTCKWADPIYETTRLLQDSRSKHYDEKLYKLVVAMGSSRASILGEAIINLADYADASKPSSVSIPLHGCSSGTILHVTVQLLTSITGFREFEQQRELREGALQSDENGLSDKVNAKVRFKNVKELSSVEEESGPHEEYADSSNTSESMYAEKPDSSSGHEIDSLKSTMSGDLNGLLRGQSPPAEKGETSDYQVHGWNSDYSVDNDLPVVYEENHKLRESLELAQSTISELQGEIKSLQSQANEIGSEMHELQHLVAAEVSSGEEMAKDVSFFRSECSKLKDEIERLRNLKINSQVHTPNDQLASATELDLDLSLPESLLHHLRIPQLVSPETDAMKNKMFEMMREMDEAKFERENLIRKMHQMECYYEALIQELDDNQKRLLGELQNLRNEHSSVCQDMGQQLIQLSREREELDILNKELERRAMISEASLRRARLNYSIAVDKLQKDLELLSSQVVSMFETNENIIKQAFPESSQTASAGIRKHTLGGDNLLEDLKESLFSQEALYQKVDEEFREMQFCNLHLDIFSKTLEEILREADVYIAQMKEKSDELARSLDFTKVANDQLTMRLQSAMEEIQALNDMALEKQTLECNLETVEKENNLLVQQVLEFEGTIKASCEEKDELSNLLKQENEVNSRLQFELSILEEELETSKRKISELASLKESLDIVLREKDSDLERNQRKYEDCCAENAELSGLWKQGNLENAMLQNEILVLKEEFESAIQNMASKLNVSNALVGKLQFNLESVANKFSASFEVVDKNAEEIEELLADLGIFGVELEEIAWKTGFIDQEIMELKIISEELERNKSSIGDLERERENISVYLQDKDEELHVERTTRENIEGSVRDLTSQLEEYRTKMAVLEAEYLELQKTHNVVEARLHDSLVCEACCREESFVITIILREALVEKHDAYENICFKLEEHQKKIAALEVDYLELQARLHDSIESETSCREENEELLMTLKSLRCDLEASVAEHNAKIEEYHKNMAVLEAEYVDLQKKYNEAEAEILFLSKEELEIMMIILKDKFVEQHGSIASSDKKLEMLQSRCDEVTLKLSEQILKTEEFKNLSLHFKELKDKAEAEKREPDGPPVIQESLRMAFVKEQYETRLQELRQQLSISRKHGEEMLFKLQDAIDEIENRKKSESLLSKRNEELSGKLLALEADMKSVLFDSCEKTKAYDEIKAKLECSDLSLECCKEEKNKIAVELARTKEQLGEVTSCNTVEQEQPGSSLDVMNLRSSMEHLQEELERMKNENSFLSKDEEININPDLHVLQAEIVQLHKVNEQLRNMFPLLDEIASSGNALERVLALEIELAESLRATNKSNIHFQSSFLKQHSDEAAVLKSFRDINELIREMLELKGKYGAMESELKEMHDRYSELSLQLAEVEGDRQKLKMTLKNVRPSRKLTPFNRSP